jgi:serine/threonine-protein kinase HipA
MSGIAAANVYKAGVQAARLERTAEGVRFSYLPEYLSSGGPAIASTLPLTSETKITPAGAVPPFLAGLLPEGRRLTALRQAVKTSADDELSLLAAIGSDTIGDVQILQQGESIEDAPAPITLDDDFASTRFSDLKGEAGISARPTFAGVQDKVSAGMISLPIARRHERYILKLNPPEIPYLVENEAFFAGLARRCKLPVSESRLVRDADGEAGLLVTRFDRVQHHQAPLALGVEDACQALGRWPADKYNVSMEEAAEALIKLTSARPVAAMGILRQVIFAWLTGNGDLHSKNLSVLATPSGELRMSPAYDLPSTLFYADQTLALSIGGRDTLTVARLNAFGQFLGLPPGAVERALRALLEGTVGLGDRLADAALPFDAKLTSKVQRQLTSRHRELSRIP